MTSRKMLTLLLVVLLSGVIPVGLALAEEEAETLFLNVTRESPTAASFNVASGATFSVTLNISNDSTAGDTGRTMDGNYSLTYSGLSLVSGPSTSGTFTDLAKGSPISFTWTFQAPTGPATGSITLGANLTSISPHRSWPSGGDKTSDSKGYTVNVLAPADTTPPTVSCTVPDQTIWHATDQSVSCTASDPSGATPSTFTLSTSVLAGSETASALTNTQFVCDGVGNCTTAGPYTFMIDKRAPVVSCGSADSTWHATDQSVTCTATDGGSGVAGSASATLSTSVPNGTETDSAYTGTHTFSDNVGNTATAGPVGPFKIDRKAPTITINVPPTASVYLLNQAVAADYSCLDGGSGVAWCTGPVPNGSNIDTSSVGPNTFTVNARDNVGNDTSLTHSYTVIYNWSGFFRPIDNLPTLNVAKAGSAIPVKFSLSGNQGLSIFAAGYPKSQVIACGTGVPTDDIEETFTAGNSSLSYDPSADQYVYVWKTEKAWANSCRQLVVKLIDGTEHLANFKFTK